MSNEELNPYAIICPTDGQVYLTEQQYNKQMANPDTRWICPVCGIQPVEFDDINFEDHMDQAYIAESREG